MSSHTADITIVHGSTAQYQANALSQQLERRGLTTQLVQGKTQRSATEVVLVLLLAIPLRTFLEAFGTSLGETAGTAFKNVIAEIFRKSDKDQGANVIILRDFRTGSDYELSENLPAKAYEQLVSEGSLGSGRYYYNDATGKWNEEGE